MSNRHYDTVENAEVIIREGETERLTSKIIKIVRDTVVRYNMLTHGDKVLVGVSAGPDSVCLLHVLEELREEYELSLHIAHLHHGFRGSEADEDVGFVRALGDDLGIPVHVEYADIPSYIKKARKSKQAGAREVRYDFFHRVASETGADRIAIGHTADDQVETFLMRLFRGAGLRGLSGIPPVRNSIIRPLIDLSREEITGYLSERAIEFRIDSSNLTPQYLRNRIRLELLPSLAKDYNPNIIDTLTRNLKIFRDEDIFLDGYIKKVYTDVVISESKEMVEFDAGRFSQLAIPVKRRLFRHAVESIAGEETVSLSFQHVEDALSLMDNTSGGEIHLPFRIMAERDGGTFSVHVKSGVLQTPEYACKVAIPGNTMIEDAGIMLAASILTGSTFGKKEKEVEGGKYKACFDMGTFSYPLIIRNRRKSDFFYPGGMGGHRKKIKDYFIDSKIRRRDRDTIPILSSPEGILWILGYRTDERFMVTESTKKILQVVAVKNAA